MQVIDVGSVPVDMVLDEVLAKGQLKHLIGYHGAACFVLVRQMVAPDCYRHLIEHVDTIDATTRHHIAFIVFYGKCSALLQRGGTEYRPYLERYALDGLSVSEGADIQCEHIHLDRTEPREGTFHPSLCEFSRNLGDMLRLRRHVVDFSLLSHHMSTATMYLMEEYHVRESHLPCLLFVDPGAPARHMLVPLDPTDALTSLYEHVLRPLSGEFGLLSPFWAMRGDIGRREAEFAEAEKVLAKVPQEIDELTKSIARSESALDPRRQALEEQAGAMESILHILRAGDFGNVQLEDAIARIDGQYLRARVREYAFAQRGWESYLQIRALRQNLWVI